MRQTAVWAKSYHAHAVDPELNKSCQIIHHHIFDVKPSQKLSGTNSWMILGSLHDIKM